METKFVLNNDGGWKRPPSEIFYIVGKNTYAMNSKTTLQQRDYDFMKNAIDLWLKTFSRDVVNNLFVETYPQPNPQVQPIQAPVQLIQAPVQRQSIDIGGKPRKYIKHIVILVNNINNCK
jgi:hypothetical protein